MKRRSISLIIVLMSFALLGVMAMQLYFLRESYQLKTQLFNQAVNESLSNLVAKIEKQDAFNFLDSKEREQHYISVKNQPKFVQSKIKHGPVNKTLTPAPVTSSAKADLSRNAGLANNQADLFKAAFIERLKNGFSSDTPRIIISQLTEKPDRMRLTSKPFSSSKKISYNREINSERYARLLEAEQYKSDLLFEKRDSALRRKYPVAFAYKDVIPDLNETPAVNLQMDVVEYQDAMGEIKQLAQVHMLPKAENSRVEISKKSARRDTVARYIVVDPLEGPKIFTIAKPKMLQLSPQILEEDHAKQLKEASRVNKFVKKIQNRNALQALVSEFQGVDLPLSDRIKFSLLDSLLKAELKSHGIETSFEYKVSSSKKDSVIFTKASTNKGFLPENTYQAKLFPKDIVRDAGLLSITFPNKNSVIFSNMSVMMGSSAGLLLVLLFCFGYTIHIVLRQKKISEMKTDFINNMTHEFKTPVATIMLASEALKDAEIVDGHDRVRRLAGIIYDENVRLGNHIERVLNIARIDKEEFKIDHIAVNVNDLVAAIVDSMALQLQNKNVALSLDLNAVNPVVYGDELHLSNVMFNLVDNAIKYGGEHPEISLTTHNQGKNLIVKIADKGIGMERDQLNKIFGQFYRIPTGNLHDVKGFGLGLSYVNNIVKLLRGSVKVKSEKGKGSEFEVILPSS